MSIHLISSSKEREAEITRRKGDINFHDVERRVALWLSDRDVMMVANKNLWVLLELFIGEVKEVIEHREHEGRPGYEAYKEALEFVDALFVLSSKVQLNRQLGGEVDYSQAVSSANGQATRSDILEHLIEVSGNVTYKSLDRDLHYLLRLSASYIIHFPIPLKISQLLTEIIDKNTLNHNAQFLSRNPLFEEKFKRQMNEDEKLAHFKHAKTVIRVIRTFIIKHVDPSSEYLGLDPKYSQAYELFIYSFMKFDKVGLSPQQAIDFVFKQLHADYGIPLPAPDTTVLRVK